MSEPTHIIHSIPSQETACLYRASDGMVLGEVQQCCVLQGENPMKRESRLFLNHHFAYQYLKTLAEQDWSQIPRGTQDPSPIMIEETSLEGAVVLAPGSVEMIVNGGRYPSVKGFNKSLKQ